MSLAQRVGQLLMVDCPSSGVSASTQVAVTRWHAGSVILDGNSSLGVGRTRIITRRLQSLAPSRVRLFIATDQEGGYVQRLRGPGFETIPSAVQQGAEPASVVYADWTRWGAALRAAGVNVDLAPVFDTVPPGNRPNPPIGDLDREYGRTPAAVASHGVAAARGLAAAGIAPTAKHFPGLGRVTGNTDTARGVTDTVTTRHDPYLHPFRAAVGAHVPFVMVSTADYARIDPHTPAIFSRTIVTDMLRGELGFHGVIITDDIGAARQVASVAPGLRAVRFIEAGGTMVLTVAPGTVAPMAAQLLARARSDAGFRKLVDAAALVVLRTKQAHGLLRA
jgi:beta-N-acetylhexosaminidase